MPSLRRICWLWSAWGACHHSRPTPSNGHQHSLHLRMWPSSASALAASGRAKASIGQLWTCQASRMCSLSRWLPPIRAPLWCSIPALPSPCPGSRRSRQSCRPGTLDRSVATPSLMCFLATPIPVGNCPRPSRRAWRILPPISTFPGKTARSPTGKGSSSAIAPMRRKKSRRCFPLASVSPTPPSAIAHCG